MLLAVVFVFLCCLVLTFSPAVRLHAWVADYNWKQWVGFLIWLIGFSLVYRQVNRILPDRDPYLLPIVAILSGWGLVELFRLNPSLGFRQTAWLGVCLIAIMIGLRIPQLFNILRRYKYLWLISGLVLCLLTFFLGTYPGGSGPRLWLKLGSIYLQPSEFLKILLIIYLAAYLADNLPIHYKLIELLAPTIILGGAALLILFAQRDLGTATLFIIIYTLIVYLSSGKRRVLLICFLGVIAALIAGYFLFDVIRIRIDAWINPWLDPSGSSYQIVQSLQAVANGGLFGRGIGLGSPGVVPVAQSDFIFAAICEEFGLSGAIALCIILAVFTVRGLGIALHAPNRFQRFLAVGVTSYLITQSLLIIGGTIRMLPLTGVTLPFISYGGSSLITAFFSIFLLMVISNQAEDQPASIENTKPYIFVGSVFLAGFTLAAGFVGWWSMVQADHLLSRTDNPRRVISDMYVMRGDILDRNNLVLAQSKGTSGNYVRTLTYAPLSATVGYSNANYGQIGIEASMDSYLRGLSGNSTTTIWTTRELYSQYPAGLDIRLSLDLSKQKIIDTGLLGHTGAAVMLNSSTGEILALSTSPTFDANQLDQQWQTWMKDENAPLLNRATMGQYPLGSAANIFIVANYLSQHALPSLLPSYDWTTIPGSLNACAVLPQTTLSWSTLLSSGCVGASNELLQTNTTNEILSLYKELGFASAPSIPIETNKAETLPTFADTSQYLVNENLRVSPMQLAIAAAEIANGGYHVSPLLVTAYQAPSGDWTLMDQVAAKEKLSNLDTKDTISLFSTSDSPYWNYVAQVTDKDKTVSWFIAGTPPNWSGVPFVMVIALEDTNATQVLTLGQNLMSSLITQ